jgi:hypothetical protein
MLGYHITRIAKGLVEIREEALSYQMSETEILSALETVKANRTRYASDLAYQRWVEFFEHALTVAREVEQPPEELERARLEQYIIRCFADDLAREELLAAVHKYTRFAARIRELNKALKEMLVCFDSRDPDFIEWWDHVDGPAEMVRARVLRYARAVYTKGGS